MIGYSSALTSVLTFLVQFFTDPIQWSTDQVLHWVLWVLKEFGISDINVNALSIPGRDLCQISQEDFFQRVPRGEILWSHLELLRKCKKPFQKSYKFCYCIWVDGKLAYKNWPHRYLFLTWRMLSIQYFVYFPYCGYCSSCLCTPNRLTKLTEYAEKNISTTSYD